MSKKKKEIGYDVRARIAAEEKAKLLEEKLAALAPPAAAPPATAAAPAPAAETKRQQLAKLRPGSAERAQFALIHQDELFAEEHAARLAAGKVA